MPRFLAPALLFEMGMGVVEVGSALAAAGVAAGGADVAAEASKEKLLLSPKGTGRGLGAEPDMI